VTEPWKTTIEMYLPFPFRCANFKWDDTTELREFFGEDEKHDGDEPDDRDELAFWCVFNHRILKSECMGLECPHCKLVGHDEYIRRLKGAVS